jgi:hypothetical protein
MLLLFSLLSHWERRVGEVRASKGMPDKFTDPLWERRAGEVRASKGMPDKFTDPMREEGRR